MSADADRLIVQARALADRVCLDPRHIRDMGDEQAWVLTELILALEVAEAQRDTLAKALEAIAGCDDDYANEIARAALAGAAPPEAET